MKLGINLYLWADHMHDGLLPVLSTLKEIGPARSGSITSSS